jgi:uncharacterized protein
LFLLSLFDSQASKYCTAFFAAVCLCFIGLYSIGSMLIAPALHGVGKPPADLAVEVISIDRADAGDISGWFIAGDPNKAGILLLHGLRSDKAAMVERARFLSKAGYAVLLIDMQAHGETPGGYITFGYLESRDAYDGVQYLRRRMPGKPVGVLGVSLGGAASLLGVAPLRVDALILEEVYSSIEHAVENRIAMRLGGFGQALAPLLLWQLEPRLDIATEALAPITAISAVKWPVMIIGASDDRHTLLAETEAMFAAAPEPKTLWVVEGAEHEDLYRFLPKAYEEKVLEFFDSHLVDAIDD